MVLNWLLPIKIKSYMKKKILQSIFLLSISTFGFAQINSGNPSVPFGSNTKYKFGIMPSNLPNGKYGGSTKAAEAYEAWKKEYIAACKDGQFRVKFDDATSTVSEGIAYGMLLSVYASDKELFDGLWKYYQSNMNSRGIMHWKMIGCDKIDQENGATDAELDVAMALIIASEQWKSSKINYKKDALTLVKNIKLHEMSKNGQTLNGDFWGDQNTCRNPSYFAPAYYTEFAKIDKENALFWQKTAIDATNNILITNRNPTSGLVSNWSDNTGAENACGNTGSGALGYGADACRNPWRMAVDYLWHGNNSSIAAKDINAKLSNFVKGYEDKLKGPYPDRNVANSSFGTYVNGSYTTFALPVMTTKNQESLNACYANVAKIKDIDAYFNSTIRCISLFVLTGNFWAPETSRNLKLKK